MANDLVAVLGARLDQFASDLNQAGDMADSAVSRIESAFDNLNPGFGGLTGLGTVMTGAAAAAGVLLGVLQKISSEVADIGKNAQYVGVSTDRFQQVRFGATQGGVSGSDATTDLKKAADLLADAKVNENSLTKILDANNIKYKDRNGEVIDFNAYLKIAIGLINSFDSIPEKTRAAQMLGLSAGWVDAVKGGVRAFEDVASKAQDAGAVIDKETIAKATVFDKEWKQATDRLGYQFKSVLADVSTGLQGLIDKASEFVAELLKSQGIQAGSGQDKFDLLADEMDIARKEALGLAQDVDQLNRVLDALKSKPGVDPGIIAGLEEARDKAKQAADETARLGKEQAAAAFPGGVPLPSARPAAADEQEGSGKLPKRKTDNSRDQFKTAVDDVAKRTATVKADTAALFENQAAQAQYRAEFRELAALMRDNAGVTQEQIDKYELLRPTMSAQNALTAAGIDLEEKKKQAFLSSTQAIGTATAAYDDAREKLNRLNTASAAIGSALSTAFADAVVEGKNLGDVFNNLLKTLEKFAINQVFGMFFNAPSSGGPSPFASIVKGIIPGFAEGTDNAPGGLAWVGERGPELVNLPKGAQVIPNAVSRGVASEGQSIVYHIDASGADSGTVMRIHQVLRQHAKAISANASAFASSQYSQATGVSRQ
jgi:hypothetical protein